MVTQNDTCTSTMPHQKNDTQYVVMYDLNLIVILSFVLSVLLILILILRLKGK